LTQWSALGALRNGAQQAIFLVVPEGRISAGVGRYCERERHAKSNDGPAAQ